MFVAVIVLAVALAGSLGLIAWLAHDDVNEAHNKGDARVAQSVTEEHLAQAQFELEVERKARIASETRAAALEEQLTHELSSPFPDAPTLDPADVRGRMLRLAQQWGAADTGRTNAGAPSEPVKAVPVKGPAGPTGDASLVSVPGDRVVP